MRKSEVVIGGGYLAKISNRICRVRIDDSRIVRTSRQRKTVWNATNLYSGRKITIRSAAKLRRKCLTNSKG